MVRFAPAVVADGGAAKLTFSGKWGNNNDTSSFTNLAGQTLAYEVSTTTLAYGSFRFDSTQSRSFEINNTGSAPVEIASINFTPGTDTAAGEAPITVTLNGSGPSLDLPVTIPGGEKRNVGVVARPNNRIGMFQGTVVVHPSNAALADRSITVTGTSTAAILALSPTIDFGVIDLDGPAPAAQTATISNTGNLALTITSLTTEPASHPPFTFNLPASPVTIQPNGSVTIPITYRPTAERRASDPDSVVIAAILSGTGVIGNPMRATIPITGRGIDRKLFVEEPTFPATFRNPGSTAPVVPITVTNTGEAPLSITAVMLTGEPIWHLVDEAQAVTIEGGNSHDFLVRFAPTNTTQAPDGELVLMNNDNDQPIKSIALKGSGKPRQVTIGPDAVYLGRAVPGGRVTKSALSISNADPTTGFVIREIKLLENVGFHFDDGAFPVELPAGGTVNVSIAFEPTAAGVFQTTAQLFLDEDPEPEAAVITVKADASGAVSIHGGGCESTSLNGVGMVIAAALLVGITRRRQRRGRRVLLVMMAIALIPVIPTVRADDVVVGVFDPTPATVTRGFQLESPEVGSAGSWVASGVVSYATDLLVLDTHNNGAQVSTDRVIQQRMMLGIGGAYAFLGRFEAGVRLPLYNQRGDEAPSGQSESVYLEPASGAAVGDLTLHAKARLARLGMSTFGASLHLTLPTSTAGQFTGVDGPTVRALALSAWSPLRRLSLSATAGGVLRKTALYQDAASISQSSGFAWGTGASYQLSDEITATAELFGELTSSGREEPGMSTIALAPIEALVGATYHRRNVAVGVAIGRGVSDGVGAPGVRGVMTLSYAAGTTSPEPRPQRVEALDRDGDGIPDAADRCPLKPEDKNGYQDDDGCPEHDADHDGVADAADKCPAQAEDKDGFQDDDGCPDLDNDEDDIADAADRCPGEPETINGKDDDDGCPDTIDPSDRAAALKAAEATFNKGRALLAAARYPRACEMFERSQQLDPQFGTRFNLAGCYDKLGKRATAWALYRELGRTDTNPARRAKSAALAAELAPSLAKLKLVVPRRPRGVRVLLDGADVTATIGAETLVDVGNRTIEATAAGYRAWTKTVEITEAGKAVTVTVDLQATP